MYVIVTLRSILWVLLSLVATLLMLSALFSAAWLVAPDKTEAIHKNENVTYTPSVGVYARCGRPLKEVDYKSASCLTLALNGFATDSEVFPDVWKAAVFFITLGLCIMSLSVLAGIISFCHQSICRKSIFTITGATQVLAGMCFIMGTILHPMGWSSNRVQNLCGQDASPFYPDKCWLGAGLYMAVIGTVLTLVAACLSVPADKSTSSDRVQHQISNGRSLICLP